jgi:hypothetical protein
LALILALAAFAAGCGSSGQSTTAPIRPDIHNIRDLQVTSKDVKAAGKDSPSAALLRWWRAMQGEDARATRAAYANGVDTAAVPNELKHLSFFLRRSRPQIRDVRTKDGTARVVTLVDAARFKPSNPNKVLVVIQTPTSFQLEREGGQWKLADNDYLAQLFKVEVTPKK